MGNELENNNTNSLLNKWKSQRKKNNGNIVIPKIPEDIDIPLSRGQQRLWFLQQLYPNNAFYNHAESYTIKGNLNKNHLFKSLQLITEEHQILKAGFPIKDGQAILKIEDDFKLLINEIDFSSSDLREAKKKAKQFISEEITKPFNLSNAPLIRVALITLAKNHYILSLNLHHIIIDEWSMRDLNNLLADYYKKLSNAEEVVAKKLETEYKDFAYWDQNRVLPENQINYWKSKLKGELQILDLQTDFKRPLNPSYSGKHHTTHFSKQDSANLFLLAKKIDTTPFNLMLAIFYTLLYRHTQQTDILIGLPITNRFHKSLQTLLGFFVDTLVLRTQFNANERFTELLSQVKANTLEGFSNKDIPFDYLVKEIQPERSLSMNPFFQVMFVYNNDVETTNFGSGIQFEKEEDINLTSSKFDVTLFVNEKNGQLSTTFEYATDLFEAATIERFSEHFKLLATGIIKNPESKISEIPMLTEQEKILFSSPRNISPKNTFSNYKAMHHIIEAAAHKNPNALAVTYNSKSLTYAELNKKANDLARHILITKNEDDTIIGLSIERSTEMIIGLLAILKAGCAYLPLDPEYPPQRLEYILNDAKVNYIVTQTTLESNFILFGAKLVLIDTFENPEDSIKLPEVSSSDLAYVIYTSGSTGNPKGVPITHKNIINSTAGRLDFYDRNPSAFLLMSSISFDSSKAGIYWTLCTGGNLIVSGKRLEQDIEKLSSTIEKHNVSHLLTLPSLYILILEHSERPKLKSLNTIMVAGEACPVKLGEMHFKTLPDANLYNEYGPTEATVWCIAHKILPTDIDNNSIPIGIPVAGSGIHLLDNDFNPVPYGSIGEICISGEGLSGYYLNRPDLTDASYSKDKGGTLLYKTGDLGKYNVNGAIEFLGRKDQQVKIRGYRVEIDEIEKSIKENTNVKDAVVVIESSESNEIKLEDIMDSDIKTLSNFMTNHLNEQEIATLFQSIESLSNKEKDYLLKQLAG